MSARVCPRKSSGRRPSTLPRSANAIAWQRSASSRRPRSALPPAAITPRRKRSRGIFSSAGSMVASTSLASRMRPANHRDDDSLGPDGLHREPGLARGAIGDRDRLGAASERDQRAGVEPIDAGGEPGIEVARDRRARSRRASSRGRARAARPSPGRARRLPRPRARLRTRARSLVGTAARASARSSCHHAM